jgi:hypothetical protein
MNAFKPVTFMEPDTFEKITELYRKPYYFEWMKRSAATLRGFDVVYILGFENGLVKVGQTRDFLTRLSAHRSSPITRDTKLFCGWRLGSQSPRGDEQKLLSLAAELGGTPHLKREWFTGVNVAELIAAAERELVPDMEPAG